METCYKLFRRDVLKKIHHRGKPLSARARDHGEVAKLRVVIYEVGISITARTYEGGKKDRLARCFRALWAIFNIFSALIATRRSHESDRRRSPPSVSTTGLAAAGRLDRLSVRRAQKKIRPPRPAALVGSGAAALTCFRWPLLWVPPS